MRPGGRGGGGGWSRMGRHGMGSFLEGDRMGKCLAEESAGWGAQGRC